MAVSAAGFLDGNFFGSTNFGFFGRRLGLGMLDLRHLSLRLGGRLGGLRLAGRLLGSSLL